MSAQMIGGEEQVTGFVWCLHCERAFPAERMKGSGAYGWECAYAPECDGGFMDLLNWASMRETHPEFPLVPEEGKVYGVYGG